MADHYHGSGRRRTAALLFGLLCCTQSAAQNAANDAADAADAAAAPDPLAELQTQNQTLREQIARLQKTAATARAFDRRNRQLETERVELERELALARQQSDALRDRSGQEWFIRGAGVLLLGVLLGALLPRLQRQRKPNHWSDL